MSGLEGPAFSLGSKAALAAARRLARTGDFERLCDRLAERFGDATGMSAAAFMDWRNDSTFMTVLLTYAKPPHSFDRVAFVEAITPLVGALDESTPARAFAGRIADTIRTEMRIAKTGDDLVRFETDRILAAISQVVRNDVEKTPAQVELDLPDECYEPPAPALEIRDIVAAVPFPQGGEVFEHDGSFLVQAVWTWGTVLLVVQGFAVVAPVFLADQATDIPGFEALVEAGRTARMTIRLPHLSGVWERDSICVLFDGDNSARELSR